MEASASQQDDTHKPQDYQASPKRPKKMRYDKLPDPPPEQTPGTFRLVADKNEEV
jgi:hypothetical protein